MLREITRPASLGRDDMGVFEKPRVGVDRDSRNCL